MKENRFLFLMVAIVILLIINYLYGTTIIRSYQSNPTYTCNYYYRPICEKKYGFDTWSLWKSIPILSILVGLTSKKIKKLIISFLFVSVLWISSVEVILRLFQIPSLFRWERSSLDYSVFTVFVGWEIALIINISVSLSLSFLVYFIKSLLNCKKKEINNQ